MNTKTPELLAPAGSMESLKAAVNAGADAVYLAGKQFGARHYATNFDDEQLNEAINFAHLRGVQVYVTVNTLIKDHELQNVAKNLLFLYEIGVDAILVQDIGVAKLAKELVPDLNLHASTQMTIHNTEGVKWAEEFGFKRVVLAREMKLKEIEEISKNIRSGKIELEIFAHGALCYSYSGQCLLSSFIGGRSGNRGMCAQPCRKPYDLILGEKDEYGRPINTNKVKIRENYLLSTRDLAVYEYLHRISKSSINSLKIEGRMRSPEYVAIVVSMYREALDSIAKGKWKPRKEDIDNLKMAFNRDFTGGYLLEKDKSAVMSRDRPGNRGVFIGSVKDYNKKNKEAVVEIKNSIIPEKGDGIVFINKNKYGMAVHESPVIYKNKVKLKVQRPLKPGTLVYITRRRSLIGEAIEIINDTKNKLKHQITVDLDVQVKRDGYILLKSKFNCPDKAMMGLNLHSDFKMQKAIKKPITEETIEEQFRKTGGTPFIIGNMYIQYPGGLFAPISELNKLRRELFEKIEENLISAYRPSKDKVKEARGKLNELQPDITAKNIKMDKKTVDLAVYADDLEILKGAVEGGCDSIYFDPFTQSALMKCKSDTTNGFQGILSLIEESISICKDTNTNFVLKLPKITSDSYLTSLNELLTEVYLERVDGIMVDGIGAAKAVLNINPGIELFASAGLNIWNYKSIEELKDTYKSFTLSPELSKDEIKTLNSNVQIRDIDTKLELLVQGNLESIISKDCIPRIAGDEIFKYENKGFLGIEDIKGHLFPIRLDNECRTHILNSVELCLINYMPLIASAGIDTVIIDARGRTKKYAHDVSLIYKKALEMGTRDYRKTKSDLNALKNEIKKISLGGITTGNFLRGVTEE